MMKKIALCAILVLVLVPAFAMAAGPQGHGAGFTQAGGQQARQQVTEQGQSGGAGQFQACSQNCEMARHMIRNQNQLQTGSAAGEATPSVSAGWQQHRYGATAGSGAMDRAMNRTHLRDGSCGNCPNL